MPTSAQVSVGVTATVLVVATGFDQTVWLHNSGGGVVMLKQRFIGNEIVGFARARLTPYDGEYPVVEPIQKAKPKEKKK